MKCYIKTKDFITYLLRNNISYGSISDQLGISPSHFNHIVHNRISVNAELRESILSKFIDLKFDDVFEIK